MQRRDPGAGGEGAQVRQVGVPDGTLLLDLFVVQQRVGELLEIALAGTPVRPAEYAVYSQLGAGALSPRELSVRLGIAPSTLTGLLRALESRGDTRRAPHPSDGRSHRVALTAAGRRTFEDCRNRFRRAIAVLHGQLDDDPDTVRALLLRVDRAAERAIGVLEAGGGPRRTPRAHHRTRDES